MQVRLWFADGGIRLTVDGGDACVGEVDTSGDAGVDFDPTALPGVEADDRTPGYRAPAYRYAAVRDGLADRRVGSAATTVDDDIAAGFPDLSPLATRYDLRPYQREALSAWRDDDCRGVVELPTGSGKTVIGLAAIAGRETATLVVVPTLDLLDQWRRELASEFDVEVGQFGGGVQQQAPITVATYDSAYLRADDVGGDFGLVVFDEVHHLGGQGFRDAARLVAAPARLGLTATFERPDGAHEVVTELLGPVVARASVDDLAGDYLAEYDVRRIEVALSASERETYETAQGTFVDYVRENGISFDSGSDYQKLVKRSGRDPAAREALLAKQRAREVMMNADAKLRELGRILERHADDRVVVFTAHTDLVYRISERFLIPAITAETGASERREILDRFRDGTYSRVVAANVLDEGVDVPDASVGVVLSGSGSSREFTQRLGRLLRPGESEHAVLYELVAADTAEERVADRRR
ncbi:DEAD/DEAH box helicase [Halobaculum sp. MBLA0143]|uniref:DEAD/DEAH box helicase n=1 Tax=Halobaculum sp. MBLA0143 TaxID=3079933 RepID=UPI003523D5FA